MNVIDIMLFKKGIQLTIDLIFPIDLQSNRELFNTFRGREIITIHTSHPLKVLKSRKSIIFIILR
jgi:hypothetical protein